ncbi:RmlC-like cupin domain-containing protein [Paraphysoderma sedebokerense]|nr:RmlC-like cupin domain-containing protein [Paraphysoderma sedebokerense]
MHPKPMTLLSTESYNPQSSLTLPSINTLISSLHLKPHPEGGYYNETYRSPNTIKTSTSPSHSISTSIIYLLPYNQRSKLHRLKQDELFHLHPSKSTATLVEIELPDSVKTIDNVIMDSIEPKITVTTLSPDHPQHIFKAGVWFGAFSDAQREEDYTLIGCTVSPGFMFQDFEMMNSEMGEWVLENTPEELKAIVSEVV